MSHYQVRRLWNGIAPILSTNLVDTGLVDASFNEELTRVANAAFDEFQGKNRGHHGDGSTRRRRRKHSTPAIEADINLDVSSNNNFFEYQRNNGYKLAIPSIAACNQVEHLEQEFFKASVQYLHAANATTIADQLANDSGVFSIDMWVAVQKGQRAHHSIHVHESAVVSGVYYSACPVGCAPLLLRKPREGGTSNGDIAEIKDNDEVLQPMEGDMFLFPSWLEHGVPLAESTTNARVSWPFNLNARLASIGNPWDIIR